MLRIIALSAALVATAASAQDGADVEWVNPDGPDAVIEREGPSASVAILSLGAEDTFSATVLGTVSVPLSDKFGASFDALVGVGGDDPIYGGAGRLFVRDPEIGLIGVYGVGTHAKFDGTEYNVFGFGAEGALYVDDFALEGAAGFTTGEKIDDGVVGVADVAYYPLDDLRVSVGGRYLNDEIYGAFGAEVLFDERGASLFTSSIFGEQDRWQLLVGLRVDFSDDNSSLQERDRMGGSATDLPLELMSGSYWAVDAYEHPETVEDAVAADPGPADDGVPVDEEPGDAAAFEAVAGLEDTVADLGDRRSRFSIIDLAEGSGAGNKIIGTSKNSSGVQGGIGDLVGGVGRGEDDMLAIVAAGIEGDERVDILGLDPAGGSALVEITMGSTTDTILFRNFSAGSLERLLGN